MAFDTLIRGGTVVDGTGGAPFNMAIQDGVIAAVGPSPGNAEHLPIETVVSKLTRNNAARYGSTDRGRIATGLRAAINLIDLPRLHAYMPRMAYDLPTDMLRLVQTVDGYATTLMRGEIDDPRSR